MNAGIEVLEARRLLAVHPGNIGARLLEQAAGVDDPAVQATVALVEADQAAIEAARQQLLDDSSDTREALKDTITAGAELLAADRQAIREAKGDPEALQAAKDKLKADRQQLRADIAAAREAIRNDTAESRTALRDATASLRAHLRQLRTDLENAGVEVPAPPVGERPRDGTGGPGFSRDVTLTPEEAQETADKIKAIAQGISGIDQAAVDALAQGLVDAASDSTLTPEERHELRDEVRAVFQSVSVGELREIARELHEILGGPGRHHRR